MTTRRFSDLPPREQQRLVRALHRYLDPKFHFPIFDSLCLLFVLYVLVLSVLAVFGLSRPVDPFVVMCLAFSLAVVWGRDLWADIQHERDRLRKINEGDE